MRPLALALRIADGQLGLVTRRQLIAAGLSDHQIRHLLCSGSLVTVFGGVHRATGSTASFEQRCLAATFAAGPGSLVSHDAAAALRRFLPEPVDIAVTVPVGRAVTRRGIVLHRSSLLEDVDRSMCGVVPVTSPARTLLDIAPALDDARLELVSDDAFRRGLLTPDALVVYLRRPALAKRPGIRRVRRIAEDRVTHGVPKSQLETPMLRIITTYRLPQPVRQLKMRILGRNVHFDFAYPNDRLAIEPEGRAPHWGRLRWQSDHDRYNVVELGNWRVLRFTYQDITDRPAYVAFVIAEKLGLRPTGWRRSKKPATFG